MAYGVIPHVINRFGLYVRGDKQVGYTGEIELPEITFLTDTVEGAGVGGSFEVVVMGMLDNMEITIPYVCISRETAELLDPTEELDLTLRGAVQGVDRESRKTVMLPLKIVMQGNAKSYKPGTLKAGGKMDGSVTINLTYYKIVFDDKTFLEIDRFADVCTINDKDVMAAIRDMC